MLVNHAVHPLQQLPLAPLLKDASLFRHFPERPDNLPQLRNTILGIGRAGIGMSLPALGSRANIFYHPLIFAPCHLCLQQIVPIRLVDDDSIRQLHNSLLDALQIITGAGQHHQHKEVYHRAHRGFRLANPHCFNQNHIVACRLAHEHSFTALARHTPQGSPGR